MVNLLLLLLLLLLLSRNQWSADFHLKHMPLPILPPRSLPPASSSSPPPPHSTRQRCDAAAAPLSHTAAATTHAGTLQLEPQMRSCVRSSRCNLLRRERVSPLSATAAPCVGTSCGVMMTFFPPDYCRKTVYIPALTTRYQRS
jgi:hypothetical protein